MARRIEFTKMEGLGNDYIYVDAARFPVDDPAALSVRLSDRHFGIGADGLVLICPSQKADFRMRMFNADGSEGLMCGNAARCIGKYVSDKGLTDKAVIELETASGIRRLALHKGPDGCVDSVTAGMGQFRIIDPALTVEACGSSFTGAVVDVGNPHFVIVVPDAAAVDPSLAGPVIEKLPVFPARTNVEFISAIGPSGLRMRVWERGSGITMACGTGACASAAAAVCAGIVSSPCDVTMDGGTLGIIVDAQSRDLMMSGPARTVFEGSVEI